MLYDVRADIISGYSVGLIAISLVIDLPWTSDRFLPFQHFVNTQMRL